MPRNIPPTLVKKLDFSEMTTTITGAVLQKELIKYRPPKAALHSLSFNCLSSTTMNLHGCELAVEGASLAASRHSIIFSRSTGLSRKFLTLFLCFTRSQKAISPFHMPNFGDHSLRINTNFDKHHCQGLQYPLFLRKS